MKKTLLLLTAFLTVTFVSAQGGLPIGGTFIQGDTTYEVTSTTPNEVEVIQGDLDGVNIVIPDNVTDMTTNQTYSVVSIGQDAYNTLLGPGKFDNLASVVLPANLRTIGFRVFRGATALTTITIPAGVTSIGDQVFRDCTGLTSITVLATTPPTFGGTGTFTNLTTSEITLNTPTGSIAAYQTANLWSGFDIDGAGDIIGTNFIVNNTTYKVSSLAPNEVELTVGDVNGVNVALPDNVTSPNGGVYSIVTIGDDAYNTLLGAGKYDNLTSITFPSNLRTIGYRVFRAATGLTTLTLPATLTKIGEAGTSNMGDTFRSCTNLTSITVLATTPPTIIGSTTFTGVTTSSITLNVPVGSESVYSAHAVWGGFNITMPTLSTNDVEQDLDFSISQSGGALSINDKNLTNASFTVINIAGQTLLTTKQTQFDISNLSSGVYIIRVETSNGTSSKRFVK